MTRIATTLCLLLAATLLSGCSSSFSIKGNIEGLGDQNMRVVYATAQGVQESWVKVKANRFEVKGKVDGPTLVTLVDVTARPIARFVLDEGDDVKVRGNCSDIYRLECKGPKLCEQWMQFHTDNATLYQSSQTDKINQLIEQYAAAHPDDELSTVLLLFDYSRATQPQLLDKQLAKLSDKAKPQALLDIWKRLQKATEAARAPQVGSMVMLASNGSYEALNPTLGRFTLMWLWTPAPEHSQQVEQLKQLQQSAKGLQVADVLMEPDSAMWRPTLRNDATTWHHFWAPEGPMNTALKPLGITSVPCFVVLDSRGKVLYHGSDLNQASKAIK